VFYVPPRDRPMMKVENWKAGRPKFLPCDDDGKFGRLEGNLRATYEESYSRYLDNLSMGFDPGLARDCLPVGIYSACWVTANPRSLMAFLSLRTHEPDAKQVSYPLYEIDVAARQVEAIFARHWPLTHAAFNAGGRVAP
jgi:thymidylate synthase (FAD)